MVVKAEPKLVTIKINGEDVTVPETATVLEACTQAGIEVPNLCFQPLLRPWGSCRLCTVEILGRRGGLVESCAAQVREGMEVATHSEEVLKSRQFLLQMYLIDHALDCPTCDKSGECYLQDNTYLHNVQVSPYQRPKLAQPYEHFSHLIDYKWDRCIICARCTRVCDEVIGVTAIEIAGRGLEANVATAWGVDLRDTTCINCGMCIAVCPVGALTDRKFGAHPWELDAAETICGFCDVGCTLNVEHNRGIVRRVSHLWDRGVNYGYTCERGKWGYEFVQHPDRLRSASIRRDGRLIDVPLETALDYAAERLSHYQGEQFAALASPDNSNEENYLLQQFSRAVMGSNNVDRTMTANQAAVDRALLESFGLPTSTNSVQELFTHTGCAMVVGPNIVDKAPVASYWVNWARLYREAKDVVISRDHFPMCDRAQVWIKPPAGAEADILNAIARVMLEENLVSPPADAPAGFQAWRDSLKDVSPEAVAQATAVPLEDIKRVARLYATGGLETATDPAAYRPSAILSTLADQQDGDVYPAAVALNNLALLTGNIGRRGGGIVAYRGPANFQGSVDVGCHPAFLPGYQALADPAAVQQFAAAWLPRWNDEVVPSNGFKRPQSLSTTSGLGFEQIIDAIESGRIKALYLGFGSHPYNYGFDARLLDVLPKLELLIVEDIYPSPLTELAHVVLPGAMFLEKDGTFTNADRTIQRVRFTLPAPGDALPSWRLIQELAQRLGYNLDHRHPSQIFEEFARLMPIYRGASYPRLERGSLEWPIKGFGTEQTVYLQVGEDLAPESLRFVADSHD